MITPILVTIVFGAGAYFLFGYIESKCNWFKRLDLRRNLTAGFAFLGFVFGVALVIYLSFLIPPESYEEEVSLLSPFMGESGGIYAVVEKDEIVFLRQRKLDGPFLMRIKNEEIRNIVFLPEGSIASPKVVVLNGARTFLMKCFLFPTNRVKFFIPPSGIKEGKANFIKGYEFVPKR